MWSSNSSECMKLMISMRDGENLSLLLPLKNWGLLHFARPIQPFHFPPAGILLSGCRGRFHLFPSKGLLPVLNFWVRSNFKRRAWLLTTGPMSPSVCLTDELDFPGFKYSNLIPANGGCQLQQKGRMPCSYCQIWIYPPIHIRETLLMRIVTCCLFFTLMLRKQRKSPRTRKSIFPLESHGLSWNGHNLCSTSFLELSSQIVCWVGYVLILQNKLTWKQSSSTCLIRLGVLGATVSCWDPFPHTSA